ncbi:MAG: dephospho-CoA kinase, partial [Polyangiaceae bacterium]
SRSSRAQSRDERLAPRSVLKLYGLTGGIASGKSTVAARFRRRGVPVVDADALAREVVQPGTGGLAAVVEAFGPGVLTAGGALDRKAMARIVFSDAAARRRLEAITHPRITALGLERAAALASEGHALACYEAALIVENGVADAFRPLVVCACPEPVQLARVRDRDGSSTEDALARIRAQKPLADKVALADFVVDTSGTLEQGGIRADEALEGVCGRVGVEFTRYALQER